MGVYFDIFLLATYYVITAQLLSLLSYREVRWRNDETHANQWKMLLITWRYRVLAYPPPMHWDSSRTGFKTRSQLKAQFSLFKQIWTKSEVLEEHEQHMERWSSISSITLPRFTAHPSWSHLHLRLTLTLYQHLMLSLLMSYLLSLNICSQFIDLTKVNFVWSCHLTATRNRPSVRHYHRTHPSSLV